MTREIRVRNLFISFDLDFFLLSKFYKRTKKLLAFHTQRQSRIGWRIAVFGCGNLLFVLFVRFACV